ncbi:Hypothetical protein PHPALM_15404 [Phytophthora palmivora]|uniref:Serine protease family S33 n=1 Tax=Phytophthora palmivora TaxID=4796 RepID=A0A2P4XSE7_9STRA|nr:Hypothetical protein PHPALM_15404 [Phytophthora palmivora]
MLMLYDKLAGEANVYTMDYRGTGRGEQLSCQGVTTGSSRLNGITPSQVPDCAQELQDKYGDLAAFSTTSAAKDLVTFISDYTNDYSTTIYGVDYGTTWVERVMHLDPPEVTGYVLDGVMTTSGSGIVNASSMDYHAGKIGDTFLSVCEENSACNARFKKKVRPVKTLKSDQDGDSPSFILRYLFGSLLTNSGLRTLIPPITYRLLRCAPKDVDVLTQFITTMNTVLLHPQDEGAALTSTLLHHLVVFSEMWEAPTPSVSALKAQFEEATLSVWASYILVPLYCAFSKEVSPICDKIDLTDYDGNGIIYEHDEYWNKPAAIPDQASVLLMSSKMDPLATHENAKYLFEALDGENKELITFQYTTGGNLIDSGTWVNLCGMAVLSSYVQNNGDLKKVDKSCIPDENTAFNWTTPIDTLHLFLSTSDAYDGVLDPTLNTSTSA